MDHWIEARHAEGLAPMPRYFMPELSTQFDPVTEIEMRCGRHVVSAGGIEYQIEMGYVLSTPERREEQRARQPERDAHLRETLWYTGEWVKRQQAE